MHTRETTEDSAAFDPADPGTPEQEWGRLLDGAQEWAPRAGPLVVVAPHPDDEVLGAGGLMQSWAAAGHSVTIVSITDGEAADRSRKGLDLIRRKELQNALRVLAPLHVSVQRVGIPDGKVFAHANRVRSVLEQHATAGATIIGPYEHDGHPDHDVVGELCTEVARVARIALVRYPVWTWHHARPPSVKALPWVRFALSSAARRAKARALQCFASQLRPTSGRPIVPGHVLAHFHRPYEAFVA